MEFQQMQDRFTIKYIYSITPPESAPQLGEYRPRLSILNGHFRGASDAARGAAALHHPLGDLIELLGVGIVRTEQRHRPSRIAANAHSRVQRQAAQEWHAHRFRRARPTALAENVQLLTAPGNH